MQRSAWGMLAAIALALATGTLGAQQPTAPEGGQTARSGPVDQLFRLPEGVALSDEQQQRLDALRDQLSGELREKLSDLRRQIDEVYTDAQRAAMRAAQTAARQAGKQGNELRQAIASAVELTARQQAQIAQLQREQRQLLESVRGRIAEVLTEAQRAQAGLRAPRGAAERPRRPAPTHANVKYGPAERNVLDVWLAESKQPTPLLISIHGGGFRGGNKSVDGDLLEQCLQAGISVAAITYRLSGEAIAPAQHHDAARAVQFLRSKAEQWNLDAGRFAATGGSAGAGLSLWLGFHDDLADPDNADPVLRESTRLSGMFVYNGQTSYDPRVIREMFPGSDTYQHSALAQLFDVDLERLDELSEEKYRLFEYVSALGHLTRDDPPVMLIYGRPLDAKVSSQGIGIHHAKFGVMLKEKMDTLGIACEVVAAGQRVGGGEATRPIDFLRKVFKLDEK